MDIAAEDAAHLQGALDGHVIRSEIISWRGNIMGHARQRYLKYPQLAHIEGGLPPKADFVQHCSALGALYTKGAEEAEALSRQHRSMVK